MHPTVLEMLAEQRQAELRRAALSPHYVAVSGARARPARGSTARIGRLRRQFASLLSADPIRTRAASAPTSAQVCCA
jgi:hypothetical protein